MDKQQIEPIYQVSVTCPNCTFESKTSKVRSSFVKTKKTDTDFCIHYEGENPDFYLVRVCIACGYAYTDNFKFTTLGKQLQERLNSIITQKWNNHDYGGRRTLKDAITVYKLALLCAQLTEQSDVIIGGLCFKLACFYRFKDNVEQEQRFLQYALDSYMNFFQNESNVNVNEAKMIYLMAEIQRRLGDYRGAVKWFDKVIKDKSITDVGIIRKSREQWQVARDQLREQEARLKAEKE
ncbi:DUF2225 domain-containing protein [Desulfuribacillus alkaliarsenatis]|uniref:DUF2225 domain-containing protein n=1 Tax=Desulfuribacillus alkaliarsenatis TaxID=766136 RepID=A0A1E5G0Q5_9FIRM|nr:DUF2225 domain-containing protein [Desulfuribacillus alkaliarsenatis]OEF96492.1 hypothetical protein BHF68_07495 [Desulfuribacillus alkaliarsenatis]